MSGPVFLVGFPGCGKSTVGVELARMAGVPFTDLDTLIEREQGMAIVELMPRVGERRFREIENDALRRLCRSVRGVVACGGGTPCNGDNMDLMLAAGTTVWLTTSTERLTARLCLPEHRAKRPQLVALTDEQIARYVERTLDRRRRHYARARLHFDSTDIETAAATTATVARLLALLRGREPAAL